MDDSNIEGMLYYEKRLDSWLATHPNFWLDYKVTPVYTDDELVPRKLILQYVGLDETGNFISIKFGSPKVSLDGYGITTVILDSYSKNAIIDYLKGTAVPSLVPIETSSQVTTPTSAESKVSETIQPVQSSVQLAPVVYAARNGSADVYWYLLDNIPSNTNFFRVVQMSEEEAVNLGKRHTSKE